MVKLNYAAARTGGHVSSYLNLRLSPSLGVAERAVAEAACDSWRKRTEAADLAEQPLLVPASTYSKALVVLARAGRIGEAREAIAAMGIKVTPLTAAIAERAAELRARHGRLRLPDAIVLATARELGGDLLSYDRRLIQLTRKRDSGS